MSTRTVEIPAGVKDALRKFRFANKKETAALSVKISKKDLAMAVDEELNDLSVEEIAEELPESSPRYVVLSHELVGSLTVDTINSNTVILTDQKHPDGRISYPLILINWAPSSSPTDLMTLHASSLSYFQQVAEIAKILEVRDGAEGLTAKAVNDRLLQN